MELFKLLGTIAVETEEAESALDDVKAKAEETGGGFDSVDESARNLSSGGFTVLKGAASNLVAEGLGKVVETLGNLVVDGFQYANDIEQYATSFEVMTGSEEKAVEMTERLQEIGASTPFELPALADTTQLLMNYGFTADDAIDKMTMLGDISQGNSDKLGRIAAAYGQMSSAGKVSLEDVKQMIEAGFNPLQEISESTGESMESLYQRISDGTISIDEITASMERSTTEGGKYFGSMDAQAQTFNGRMSTLKDTANESIGNILGPLLQKMADEWLPKVTDAVGKVDEGFTKFSTWISENQTLLAVLGTVIGVITAALAAQAVVQGIQIAMNAAEVTSLGALIAAKAASAAATLAALAPYLLITAAIAAVIAIIVVCVKHWDEIKEKVAEVAENVSNKVEELKAAIAEKFEAIKAAISEKVTAAKEKIQSVFENIKNTISEKITAAKNKVSEIFTNIKDTVNEKVTSAKNKVSEVFGNIKSTISEKVTGAKTKVTEVFDSIKNSISEKITAAKDKVSEVIEKIKGLFNFTWSLPSLKLPHFSWSGKFSLNPISVPKFSISWYKKAMDNAMLLDNPTIFGASGNTLLGAGEAGQEVVSGANTLMGMIGDAVRTENNDVVQKLDRICDLLVQFFPDVLTAMNDQVMVLDDGTLVAKMAPGMDAALGRLAIRKGRGR